MPVIGYDPGPTAQVGHMRATAAVRSTLGVRSVVFGNARRCAFEPARTITMLDYEGSPLKSESRQRCEKAAEWRATASPPAEALRRGSGFDSLLGL